MDGLRWLLLIFGLLVIAGVYLYSRKERQSSTVDADDSPRFAPTIGDKDSDPIEAGFESSASEDDAPESVSAERVAQKIVTLRLVAKNKGAFPGDELILSLRGIGMRSGKFGIYHRYDGNDESRTIFSAASLVEPGSFDLANIKDQKIPGISLFMVLPGPMDGAKGFDLMMAAARALSQSLDAELLDESGSTLSIQRERYLREEIIQHQHTSVLA